MFASIFAGMASVLLIVMALMYLIVSRRYVGWLKIKHHGTAAGVTSSGAKSGSHEHDLYTEGVEDIRMTTRILLVTVGLTLAITLVPVFGWLVWMVAGLPGYATRPFEGSEVFFLVMGVIAMLLSALFGIVSKVLSRRMAPPVNRGRSTPMRRRSA